ncbi:MAG: SprT-like domain-containing protein [Planctomycetota bacterium]|nr:SprT-like domain-containing protein [Planctomycetota bacterium]
MEPHAARKLAVELLAQYGLADWTFTFDHARRRFGSCQPSRKVITLSKWLTFLNGPEQVSETILHEIAHALTPGDGHGKRWRAACLRVGAKPERCYDEKSVNAPPARPAPFLIGCKVCDWWADRHRVTRRRLLCRHCRAEVVLKEKLTGLLYTTAGRPLAKG